MVAATIRKIHAPNQLAAVFEVSGSPDENLEYTFTPPDKADNGADGVNQLGSGIEIRSDHVGRFRDTGDTVALGESPH